MLFHFFNFSQCVVCIFGHKKDLQSYCNDTTQGKRGNDR